MFFLYILNSTEVQGISVVWPATPEFVEHPSCCLPSPFSSAPPHHNLLTLLCLCSYLILPEIGDTVLAYALYNHNLGSDYSNTWKKSIVINTSTFLHPKEQKKATLGMNTGKSYWGPVFLSTWEERHENQEFKIILGYIGSHETLLKKKKRDPPKCLQSYFFQNNEV